MTIPITLTARELAALRETFGANVDVAAKTNQWVHDWLIQFTRDCDAKESSRLTSAIAGVNPAVVEQVYRLLGMRK